MSRYVPGAQIKAFMDTVRPSMASELALERGFYDGDYDVVAVPKTPLRPQLEKVRRAAYAKWPQTVISFENIVDWVREGASGTLTGEFGMRVSPSTPEKGAVRLINNGVFERQW